VEPESGQTVEIEQPIEQPARPERTADGRFAPAKPFDENELRNRIDVEEVRNAELIDRALQSGLIIPDDSMDASLWAKAFRGRIAQAERESHSTPTQPVETESESTDSEPEASQASGSEQAILDSYRERAQAFAAENPDFSDLVGALELPPHIAPAVELAVLTEVNGPQIAYELARNPQIVTDLAQMTPAQAASKIGRLAEHLDRQKDYYENSGYDALYADVPLDLVNEFHRKSRELHQQNPLTDEELELAKSVHIEPSISKLLIATGAADVAHFLIRNPSKMTRLNGMHPLAAAAELAEIRAELRSEASAKPERRLPKPISPGRKTVATDTSLSDNLSPSEWKKRFDRKMGYSGG
jgi:hypothetical protein